MPPTGGFRGEDLLLSPQKVKYYIWRHHNFLRINCAHNKYLHEIRAQYLQYFSSYTPHRHPQDARYCPPLPYTISSQVI